MGIISGTPAAAATTAASVAVTDSDGNVTVIPVLFAISGQFLFTDIMGTGGASTNWALAGGFGPTGVAPIAWQTGAFGSLQNDAGLGFNFVWKGTGNPVTTPRCHVIPLLIYESLYFAQNQFVECTNIFSSVAPAANSCGLAVMMSADVDTAYVLEVDTVGNAYNLARTVNETRVFLTGGGGPVANGNVLRLEATINPGDVTIEFFKNGVSQFSFADAAANRITFGAPGLYARAGTGVLGNNQSQWRNFTAGRL
jgi:hypothetical protein